jgi:hypothetical protein
LKRGNILIVFVVRDLLHAHALPDLSGNGPAADRVAQRQMNPVDRSSFFEISQCNGRVPPAATVSGSGQGEAS